MAERKYYWLKLQRDFFKRHDIQIVENLPNGKDYILFYLKLLCESVDHEGNLRFSDNIPYNAEMLATLTNTNIDVVRSAIKTLTALNMMEILDDETIYMTAIEKMIGAETEWAEKKRAFRDKKKLEASEDIVLDMSSICPQGVLSMSDKSKSIELEKEIEKEKEKKKAPKAPPVDYESLLASYSWTGSTKDTVREWIKYKIERREGYKATSAMTLFKQIDKAIEAHGEDAVKEAILNAISNNYMGMGLDRIPTAKPKPASKANFTERKPQESYDDLLKIKIGGDSE